MTEVNQTPIDPKVEAMMQSLKRIFLEGVDWQELAAHYSCLIDERDVQIALLQSENERVKVANRALMLGIPSPLPEEMLMVEILAELARARAKFPGENVTTLALVEEVGELAKATFSESRQRVREEAVQVAVMAMRVVLDGDSTLDDWRASHGLDPLVEG